MVELGNFYSFPADQVEMLERCKSHTPDMPYLIRVTLISGRTLSVVYAQERKRDDDWAALHTRIDRELNRGGKQISNRLFLIEDMVHQIDVRQLRIWQQLKQLIAVLDVPDGMASDPEEDTL